LPSSNRTPHRGSYDPSRNSTTSTLTNDKIATATITNLNHDMASPRLNDSSQSSEPDLDPDNLSLNQLVDLFLASKRSLSCINQVWRAREIVHTARDAVEDNAKVSARNSFVRYAVDVQLESLEAIRLGGGLIQSETGEEHDVGKIFAF
jgi:hypothetical protein